MNLPGIKARVRTFPALPGVYLMKNAAGGIIYVGKAKNLRARALNYFRAGGDGRPTIPYLLARLDRMEFVVTDTEKEALLLENNLIKKHRPLYNIYFRDDKTFPSLRLDPREKFPRLSFVRRTKADGCVYFGPYSSALALKIALKLAQKLFPLRLCSDNVFRHRSRPCLYHQMGRCPAPCVGLIAPEKYREAVEQATLFLRGRQPALLKNLRDKMREEAGALRFEQAAALRELIGAIEETIDRQKMSAVKALDQDVIVLARRFEEAVVQVFHLRQGKMTGGRSEYFPRAHPDDAEALESFVAQFYSGNRLVPDEILLSAPLSDTAVIKAVLREKKGRRVSVGVPVTGPKRRLVELAMKNASLALLRSGAEPAGGGLMATVRSQLGLRNLPRRVECFDISNLSGREAAGSMAVFVDGRKSPDDYRRFRVRTLATSDDYGMMREVLSRRYERVKREGQPPDLILVDGGKGQLGEAQKALERTGLDYPDVAGLAKERERGGERVIDRVYLPGSGQPLFLPPDSPALRFLMRVRDEAHRFALAYHRNLRRAAILKKQ
jgi:excinuclease ABC subunit C